MLKIFTPLFAVSLLISLLNSCAIPPEDEGPSEPVTEPVVEEPTPVATTNPTEGWRMLADDTKLPTEAQLADGAESSLGESSPDDQSGNSPSTSVKPPASEPEDQLAPSE